MTANDHKFYLDYLNKIVFEYSNTYHNSFNKNLYIIIFIKYIINHLIHAYFSTFSEEFESSHKSPEFKVCDWVTITKYKNIFSKG